MLVPAPFGPNYPKLEGLEKFRRAARVRELTREEKQAYGEAVGEAIRKQQRRDLMSTLAPNVSMTKPPLDRSPSPLSVKYSEPNILPMAGDPAPSSKERNADKWDRPRLREQRLYEHAMRAK